MLNRINAVLLISVLLISYPALAVSDNLKCGESELFAKNYKLNFMDRSSTVKLIIKDMKTLDVDILDLSELEMEKSLHKLLLTEREPYILENQQEYMEIKEQYVRIVQMYQNAKRNKKSVDEKTKASRAKLVNRMDELKKDCLTEKHLFGFLQEARRIMWFKIQCDKNILRNKKAYCNQIRNTFQ